MRLKSPILMFFFSAVFLFAEEQPDSVLKSFPEVKVTADRITGASALKYSSFSSINGKEIENLGAWQLSEAIAYSPSAFINDYGGLGGVKTISLRSASANQTLVLLDGMKINSSQNGLVDFSVLPVSLLKSVEIVRGGASALFGGNAVGGVINLSPAIPDRNYLDCSLAAGSFGEKRVSGDGAGNFGFVKLSGSAEYTYTDGDYAFETSGGEEMKRKNADFENLAMSLAAEKNVSDWKLKSRVIARSSARGVPGPAISEGGEQFVSSARLSEKEIIWLTRASTLLSESSSLFFGVSARSNDYKYKDTDFFGSEYEALDNFFVNRDFGFSSKYALAFGSTLFYFRTELNYADLRGDQLDRSLSGFIERSSAVLSARAESKAKLWEDFFASYQAALRMDAISDAGTALSPLVGVRLKKADFPAEIKSQWSYNFRAPSFNEMYYMNFGNADLSPERSNSFELGVSADIFEDVTLYCGAFYLDVSDKILATPKSQVSWSAENIARVETQGMECSASARFFGDKLRADISYAYRRSENQSYGNINKGEILPYSPEEVLSASVFGNVSNLNMGASVRYSSYYYSLPDNTREAIMPAYFLANLHVIYKFDFDSFDLKLRADCKNLFGERYSIIKNYPMPGRSFRFGVRFEM